jgi:hypothetical protein
MRLARLFSVLLSTMAGCARYEYDIIRPPEVAQHIGSGNDAVIVLDPLIYRMRSMGSHLVIRIQNPTTDRIQLLGAQSSVVDPHGESHPLRSQTIAPNSFIKLILPPMPPQVAPAGPTIGIGIGAGFGAAYPYSYGCYDPLWERPRYYAVNDAEGTYYWEWTGESDVRVNLVFQRDEQKPFSHEFIFHRRKM